MSYCDGASCFSLRPVCKTMHVKCLFGIVMVPVYVFVTLLKVENSVKYYNIVPFFGPFHMQCSVYILNSSADMRYYL